LSQLDRLVKSISENAPQGVKFDRRTLAQLLAGMQQFQEDALGINVSASYCACWNLHHDHRPHFTGSTSPHFTPITSILQIPC
jgi:hypothetical protein